MAAAQYQIPGGGFINEQEDGTEYMLPGVGYFNEPAAPAGGGVFTPYYWRQHIAGGMHGETA